MIRFYTWNTPNGVKVAIMLAETGLTHRVIPVNINAGDQFDAEFLNISPNNRIPAIVDEDGPDGGPLSLFESGAILIYLAEKTGRFLAANGNGRHSTIQWLMFQMANIGPMLGQAGHFRNYAPEPVPYALSRYTREAGRLYGVLDRRLAGSAWLAGDAYSIADMATFPWIRSHERHGQRLADYPHVQRWFSAIDERPAVRRGIDALQGLTAVLDDRAREMLFGDTQYRRR